MTCRSSGKRSALLCSAWLRIRAWSFRGSLRGREPSRDAQRRDALIACLAVVVRLARPGATPCCRITSVRDTCRIVGALHRHSADRGGCRYRRGRGGRRRIPLIISRLCVGGLGIGLFSRLRGLLLPALRARDEHHRRDSRNQKDERGFVHGICMNDSRPHRSVSQKSTGWRNTEAARCRPWRATVADGPISHPTVRPARPIPYPARKARLGWSSRTGST